MAWAAKRGDCSMIEALVEANASPDLSLCPPDEKAKAEPHPPLYLALVRGKADAAQLLLRARANPAETEPVRGQTALHAAVATEAIPEPLLLELLRLTTSKVSGTVGATVGA